MGATFSKDRWETKEDVNAMLVRCRKPSGLEDLELYSFRFVVDCSDLSVGQAMQFSVWCADKADKKGDRGGGGGGGGGDRGPVARHLLHEDDNDKQFYTVNCSTKLNFWAELAARELSNFAPTIRFNRNY